MNERKRTWAEIQNLVNEECVVEWLPVLVYKIPIRNRFGNLHPPVSPHGPIWNVDKVFVNSGPTRACEGGMRTYNLRRVLQTTLLLLGIPALIFGLLHL